MSDTAVLNYDPNFIRDGKSKKVELTLGQWQFRKSFIVDVGGNVGGLSIIDAAAEMLYERFCDEADADESRGEYDDGSGAIIHVHLEKPANDGSGDMDTLLVEYDPIYDRDGEDWVKGMVVKAEIIDLFEPDVI